MRPRKPKLCFECGRAAVAEVYPRKYKAKTPHRLVCGYHIKAYLGGEFHRKHFEKDIVPSRRLIGYAPPEPGYGAKL